MSLTGGVAHNYYAPYRSVRPISILFPFLAEPEPGSEVIISKTERADELGFSGHSFIHSDKNDWSPKLGLALSPTGNNRFVLRAGYRLHHFPFSSQRARKLHRSKLSFFSKRGCAFRTGES